MARARNIKPGFFRSEELGSMDPMAQLLFAGLWLLADRSGRLEDKPLTIKAEIFPYRDADVDRLLAILAEGLDPLVLRYSASVPSGTGKIQKRFIQIVNFTKHQNPHRNEQPSQIPPPPQVVESTDTRDKSCTAREEIGTSTVLAQDKHQTSTVLVPPKSERLGLIPDSGFLIPDSGFLIPDSPHVPLTPPDAAQPDPGGGDDSIPEKPKRRPEDPKPVSGILPQLLGRVNPRAAATSHDPPSDPDDWHEDTPLEASSKRIAEAYPGGIHWHVVADAANRQVGGNRADLAILEAHTLAWCEVWRAKPRFAPKLVPWLTDGGWLKPPPQPDDPFSVLDEVEAETAKGGT